MKKKYVTPIIAVEHYELTQAIAACETKIGFLNSECVLNDSDATWDMKDYAIQGFFQSGADGKPGCGTVAIGMDGFDKICYHTNTKAAFNS